MADDQPRRESLLIATPCYNEVESLPHYMARLGAFTDRLRDRLDVHVLLIDDGSRDGTAEMIEEIAATHREVVAVHHNRNFGYGAAIKTALSVGFMNGSDLIAFVDADSNYDQADIVPMLAHITEDVEIVNASIFAPSGEWRYPWYRMILSRGCALAYATVLRRRARGVYTFTCGFRIYRARIAPAILPKSDDFVATAEIMTRSLQAGFRVVDMPVRNHRRAHGRSKMRALRVAGGHLRFLMTTMLRRVGAPQDPGDHLRRVGVDRAVEALRPVAT